jgi:hypothetical protein
VVSPILSLRPIFQALTSAVICRQARLWEFRRQPGFCRQLPRELENTPDPSIEGGGGLGQVANLVLAIVLGCRGSLLNVAQLIVDLLFGDFGSALSQILIALTIELNSNPSEIRVLHAQRFNLPSGSKNCTCRRKCLGYHSQKSASYRNWLRRDRPEIAAYRHV